MTTDYTDHFRLNLPDFRIGPWHDLVNQDFEKIDELIMGLYQGVNTQPWANNVHFVPGQVAIDETDNSFWVCVTEHTSAATGTFAADRAAHPTYWTRVVVGIVPRGEWQNNTHYFPSDLVSSSVSHVIAMCKTEHTSNASGTIRDDAIFWTFIADMGSIVVDAESVGYDHTVSGVTQTNLQDTTDDLYAKNASQQTAINSNTSDVTSLTSRMGAVESTNTTQDTNIAANSAAIATKISEAPVDGTLYGRKNAVWSPVPASGISDAPSDGVYYTRRNAAWAAGVEEAPNDGTSYVRKNKAWTAAAGGGGAAVYVQDTPPGSPTAGSLWWESDTGQLFIYYNDGNTSQWVMAASPTASGSPAYINNANQWTAQQTFPVATLTDGATVNWDTKNAQKAKVTLGGNRTIAAATSLVEGGTYYLWVIQDGTGSRTLTWASSGAGSYDFGAAGAPTLTTTLNKADLLTFEALSIAGTLKMRYTGIAKGFA